MISLLVVAIFAVLTAGTLAILQINHHQQTSTSSSSSLSSSTSTSGSSPLTVSSTSSATQVGRVSATYVTSSAPNSSQWLIVKSVSSPFSVFANDTGLIQEYSSLSLLNQTKIGVYCNSINSDGACSSFKMYEETGWYWDSANEILYVHYVGDRAVSITIYVNS